MALTNLFANYSPEESNNDIKSVGAAGIYNCGIHTITGAEIFIYETTWNDTTYTNADIVLTAESGATMTDSLRTTPKSNQTQPDLINYMHNIAVVTDTVPALEQLKTTFNALPLVPYKDKYGKDHKAKSIKLFSNSKFKIMTYSEVSGSANGIFTTQRLTLNQVFRFIDGASLSEIKDKKEDVGGSLAYWTEDTSKCAAKAQIQWKDEGKRDDRDTEILELVVDYLKDDNVLTKAQREKIQGHWDVDFAKSVLSDNTTAATNTSVNVDEVEADDDDQVPFP